MRSPEIKKTMRHQKPKPFLFLTRVIIEIKASSVKF